ncbi:reverse transcriptase [Corchorus capsularis]|uniref:Reverse transcriptase n=1 Tax=Corchorus capsularis TaxID=210143 RepID=A0A1R3G7D9_COCAP|nr:reverse transcriptase [Corchorus capsularis]
MSRNRLSSQRFHNGDERRSFNVQVTLTDQILLQIGGCDFFSVFVDNISRRITRANLWKEFSVFGVVVDVFLSTRRRNDDATTFAFVRFRATQVQKGSRVQETKRVVPQFKAPRPKIAVLETRKDNRSFAGVVNGERDKSIRIWDGDKKEGRNEIGRDRASTNLTKEHKECAVSFVKESTDMKMVESVVIEADNLIPESDMEWISRSAIGLLRSYIHHKSVQDSCDQGGISCYVRPLGGSLVLLTFEDKEVMEFYLNNHESWFQVWFSSIKPCEGSIRCQDRLVWITLEAVPIQLWHESFFSKIGNTWGKFITVDDSPYKRCRFDVARILVSIGSGVSLPSKVDVLIQGEKVVIPMVFEPAVDFVRLDSNWKFTGKKKQLVDEADEEDSNSSDALSSSKGIFEDSCMQRSFSKLEEGGGSRSKFNEVEASFINWSQPLENYVEEGQKLLGCEQSGGLNLEMKDGEQEINGEDTIFDRPTDNGPIIVSSSSDERIMQIEASKENFNREIVLFNGSVARVGGPKDEKKKGRLKVRGRRRNRKKTAEFCNGAKKGDGNDDAERKLFWEELLELKMNYNFPWVLGGEFNVTRSPEEKRGATRNVNAMLDFSEFIDNAELVDLPMLGGKFTWSSKRDTPSMSRLDRVLFDVCFLNLFSCLHQRCLPRSLSDHNPVIVESSEVDWGPKPFKFCNHWLDHCSFKDLVNNSWHSLPYELEAGSAIWSKLKKFKPIIKQWQQQVCNIDPMEIQKLEEEIDELEKLDPVVKRDLSSKRANLWSLYRAEERAWHQKSRAKWIKEGDRNTKYFHMVASARRSANFINNINHNGMTLSHPKEMKKAVADRFESFYNSSTTLELDDLDCDFKKLNLDQVDFLESPFTEKEVWEAIDSCDGNKSPGPDGFNLNFFKSYWRAVKEEVMIFMEDFHRTGSFDRRINSSFITLIPKCSGASSLKDYRPICLVGSIYKILAKVLANRIRRVIEDVVSHNQFAFIKGRQILDAVLIANEVVDFLKVVEKRKLHLVDWQTLTTPKSQGGLGISKLEVRNGALLTKWIWRFGNEKDSYWRSVVVARHNWPNDCIFPLLETSRKSSLVWKNIASPLESSNRFHDVLVSGFGLLIGNGKRISFWREEWIPGVILKQDYPRIFALVVNKTGKVEEFGNWSRGMWNWNIVLRRSVFDWERDQWDKFLTVIHGTFISEDDPDKLIWKNAASDLLELIKIRLARWSKAKWPGMQYTVDNFVREPQFVSAPVAKKKSCFSSMWSKPLKGCLKFNVDGSAYGKPGPAGIGGILRDEAGNSLVVFSKSIGVADSNYAEFVAIREAFIIFSASKWCDSHFLIVESDSENAVT